MDERRPVTCCCKEWSCRSCWEKVPVTGFPCESVSPSGAPGCVGSGGTGGVLDGPAAGAPYEVDGRGREAVPEGAGAGLTGVIDGASPAGADTGFTGAIDGPCVGAAVKACWMVWVSEGSKVWVIAAVMPAVIPSVSPSSAVAIGSVVATGGPDVEGVG